MFCNKVTEVIFVSILTESPISSWHNHFQHKLVTLLRKQCFNSFSKLFENKSLHCQEMTFNYISIIRIIFMVEGFFPIFLKFKY